MTSGCIDDDDLLVLELLDTAFDDTCGIGFTRLPVDIDTNLLSQLLQLVECGGPVDIRSDESDGESLLRIV